MPTTPTTIQAAPTAAVTFTDETLHKAAGLAADSYRPLWTGPSGEESSGEAVARHLDATRALLDQRGWTHLYRYDTPATAHIPADDTGMTVKDMLRALLRLVRDETAAHTPPLALNTALREVGTTDDGDTDTDYIAMSVLDVVVQARTGSDTARCTPWSERQGRTYEDITTLLTAGARFARTYGPGATEANAA
ncbi:DUF6197 family protein [Streptomyces sp. A5-4]|uniref:DUF6197 family protein n=1 Tax=Streptomyces sp. A5-4 TaxID=3384771 RepID=UPI003DA9D754